MAETSHGWPDQEHIDYGGICATRSQAYAHAFCVCRTRLNGDLQAASRAAWKLTMDVPAIDEGTASTLVPWESVRETLEQETGRGKLP